MLVLLDKMLYNGICNELKVSHLQDKVKCAVRDIDHLGSKFNEAVKKEYGAQFIKDATYVIGFMENVEEPEDNEEDNKEDTEENTEDTEKDTEEKGEEKDDSNKENEELNESVKVQDLSKSMQLKTLTPKASKTKCVKENETDTKKKSKKKAKAVGMPIEIKKDDEGEEGGEDAGGEGMAMDEAETTATGADLKKKIIECIVRYFKLNQDKEEEKVELYDLPEFIEGKNVYFAKLTIKDNKQV